MVLCSQAKSKRYQINDVESEAQWKDFYSSQFSHRCLVKTGSILGNALRQLCQSTSKIWKWGRLIKHFFKTQRWWEAREASRKISPSSSVGFSFSTSSHSAVIIAKCYGHKAEKHVSVAPWLNHPHCVVLRTIGNVFVSKREVKLMRIDKKLTVTLTTGSVLEDFQLKPFLTLLQKLQQLCPSHPSEILTNPIGYKAVQWDWTLWQPSYAWHPHLRSVFQLARLKSFKFSTAVLTVCHLTCHCGRVCVY